MGSALENYDSTGRDRVLVANKQCAAMSTKQDEQSEGQQRGRTLCPAEARKLFLKGRRSRRAQEDCPWQGREKGTAPRAVAGSIREEREAGLVQMLTGGWWETKTRRETQART